MSIRKDVVKKAHLLNRILHENSEQYFHSRPMASSRSAIVIPEKKEKHLFNVSYDIKDLLSIAALTQSSVLMTGGTDTGKTTLARLAMNGLLGKEEEGWHRIDVDNDFGKDAYTDVNFGVIVDGKKQSDGLIQASPYLFLPGLIADEINRAHPSIINKLLHIMDKDISLPNGERVKIGCSVGGIKYQFQIAAINEGADYSGTFGIDRALRRRTIIEIPMDIFPPTPFDRLCVQKYGRKETVLKNSKSNIEDIVDIYKEIESNLKLHTVAEMFTNYLAAFDFCSYSLSGEKGAVQSKNGSVRHICAGKPIQIGDLPTGDEGDGGIGCFFLRTFENELCPYVRGISSGITKNLIAVSRGFALLRATKFVELADGVVNGENKKALSYSINNPDEFRASLKSYVGMPVEGRDLVNAAVDKYITNLEVELCDVESALGFVGYSKLGISDPWVLKYYQGNRYEAVRNFSRVARDKFEEGLARTELANLEAVLSGQGSPNDIDNIRKYCNKENPWLWRVLEPYVQNREINSEKDSIDAIYGS